MPVPPSREVDDDADQGEEELPIAAGRIEELRRARRRRRVAEIHWVDALYRVYIAALFGGIALALIAGAVGDRPLTGGQLDDLTSRGPAVIGLVGALAVGMGLRSGSRGGPLALEAGDVRHVLLAPVDRGQALRAPAWRLIRSRLFVAVLVGAAAGRFAAHRLPETVAEWMVAGAVAVGLLIALHLGAALAAGGRRMSRPVATGLAVALVGWSAADALRVGDGAVPASPGRAVGWVALAPLDPHLAAVVALVVALALVALGLAVVGGMSVEAAERRTALVGQIRFAATLQDVRTVLVLRRQLAADRPRDRPWIRLAGPTRRPVWRRAWAGLLRFPSVRVARVVALAVLAGLVLRATWADNAPLVIVAGLLLWVAGLDLVEPLGEEIDHPTRQSSYPRLPGDLQVRLLAAPAAAAAAVGAVTGAVAVAPGPGAVPVAAGLAAGVVGALAGLMGAAGTVVSGAASGGEDMSLIAPEVAGTRLVLRSAWPPALAILAVLPLLRVEADLRADRPPLGTAVSLWFAIGALLLLVVAWVHQREPIRVWFAEAMQAAQASNAPAGAAGPADEADPDADDADEANADEVDDDDDDPDAGSEEDRS